MSNKVLKFFRENPIAVGFGAKFIGFAVFGIGWYHSVNFKLETLENEVESLKQVIESRYPNNISMVIADREGRLKRCNESLDRAGQAVNSIFSHHQRCIEREKSRAF